MRPAIIFTFLACSTMLESADRIQIGIRLQTPPTMPPSLVKAVIRETERHWTFPALSLHWHDSSRRSADHDNRLLIVHFVGECSLVMPRPSDLDKPLGHTHVSDKTVLPFIDVNCAAVSANMSQRERPGVFLRQDKYAHALATVLTHEMVHALTASSNHDSAGIMQPRLSPGDLEDEDIGFTPNVIGELEEALRVTLSEERRR